MYHANIYLVFDTNIFIDFNDSYILCNFKATVFEKRK